MQTQNFNSQVYDIMRKNKENSKSYTLAFRVDADVLSKLEKRASESNISIHEQARILMLDALRNEEIGTEIQRTREDIQDLKLSVAVGFEALLVKAGNVDKETARDWITEQFRKR